MHKIFLKNFNIFLIEKTFLKNILYHVTKYIGWWSGLKFVFLLFFLKSDLSVYLVLWCIIFF